MLKKLTLFIKTGKFCVERRCTVCNLDKKNGEPSQYFVPRDPDEGEDSSWDQPSSTEEEEE